jgi:hypothetical protein
VFAQEFYSLFLNKTLELHLNTMEKIVFEFSILYIIYSAQYIVYSAQYTIYSILPTVHSVLYIVYCRTKEIKKLS